jgi:acetyl-CoA carboxylase carboxyl transferase subunit alpha
MQLLEFEKPIAELEREIDKLRAKAESQNIDMSAEISNMESKLAQTRREIYENLTPWNRVQIARHTQRPFMLDYLAHAFTDFCELHGDRRIGDDHAMPGGFARIGGRRVVVIGHQKGRDTKENLRRNFGSAHPEGYRKALRLMKLAEKFGSGGALGIGIADRVLMLENAYYSVISPEGCAAILWKHRKHAPEAAEAMKLSAPDLLKLKLIDGVIAEPVGGAHHDHLATAAALKHSILTEIEALEKLSESELLDSRYAKFRSFGEWEGK